MLLRALVLLAWMQAPATDPAPEPAAVTPLDAALAPKPYDAAPFAQGIRAHYTKRIQQRMGIRALGDLPLYQLEIEFDALQAELAVSQEVQLASPWSEPVSELVFRTLANARHLSPDGRQSLSMETVTVNGLPVEARQLGPTSLMVPLPKPLAPKERVRVGFRYQLHLPRLPPQAAAAVGLTSPSDMLQQLYGQQAQAGYGILGHSAGVFNLGYFYPVLAARDKGAWVTSEPAGMGDMAHFEVANFLVKVTAPQNMLIASSGIRVGDQPLGSGEGAARETFLLGTAVRNFALQLSTRYEQIEKTVSGVRLRYLYVAEHAQGAEQILDQAAYALLAYQKLFGPYPWPELEVAEAPLTGGAGGVEYPGLVTLAMGLAAGPTGNPTADLMGMLLQQSQTTEYVLAHELAHQWWHALVGSDSNAHPFVDEALANYSAVLYFEARHGQAKAGDQLQLQLALPYQLMRMLGGQDGPVDQPTRAFANQLQYSALVYGKGALFYHALRRLLGKQRFLAGLRAYASQHAFRQAGPEDLLTSLADASGKPAEVRRLYRRWIQERHGDEDIGRLDPDAALAQLMGQMQNLPGFHNMQVQGLDPATLKLFQDAVNQLGGGP